MPSSVVITADNAPAIVNEWIGDEGIFVLREGYIGRYKTTEQAEQECKSDDRLRGPYTSDECLSAVGDVVPRSSGQVRVTTWMETGLYIEVFNHDFVNGLATGSLRLVRYGAQVRRTYGTCIETLHIHFLRESASEPFEGEVELRLQQDGRPLMADLPLTVDMDSGKWEKYVFKEIAFQPRTTGICTLTMYRDGQALASFDMNIIEEINALPEIVEAMGVAGRVTGV
jgi:hypothetical protein